MTKTMLDIAVMVRTISEERRDWLVHVVEEALVLTLPSITLLMPGFVTQFGVAYVQYMVPSTKSAEASSKALKHVYLQSSTDIYAGDCRYGTSRCKQA